MPRTAKRTAKPTAVPRRRESADGPGRRRNIGWQSDRASRHSRTSLDVLLEWLTTPGNYSRWAARSAASGVVDASGEGRISLCREVNALLQQEGIAHRKDMDIYAKIIVVEKSFQAAKKWLEETALMPKFLNGTAGKDVDANVNQLCRHYKELAPAFAVTNNESAASKVVDITQRSSEGESDDDDEDGGGKSDTTTSTDYGGSNEDKPRERGESGGKDTDTEMDTAASGAGGVDGASEQASRSDEAASSSQPELYTMSPVHGEADTATTTTTSSAAASASRSASKQEQVASKEYGKARSVVGSVVGNDEETKESEPPAPDSPSTPAAVAAAAASSSQTSTGSNKGRRIRQRLLDQLSDEDSAPPISDQPRQHRQPKQAASIAASSASTLTKTVVSVERVERSVAAGSPAREKTAGGGAASSLQSAKPSIAPKRKTSGLLKDAISASSAELSPPSARKKQKTQWTEQQELKKQQQQEEEQKKKQQREELKQKKKQQQEELKKKKQLQQEQDELKQQQLEEAKRKKEQQEELRKKAPSSTSSKQQPPRHPAELQAILRACEEEREQRNALFQLQCDSLLQELEQKKIKVVYETALARKKLLDAGVAQSEVDRILPL